MMKRCVTSLPAKLEMPGSGDQFFGNQPQGGELVLEAYPIRQWKSHDHGEQLCVRQAASTGARRRASSCTSKRNRRIRKCRHARQYESSTVTNGNEYKYKERDVRATPEKHTRRDETRRCAICRAARQAFFHGSTAKHKTYVTTSKTVARCTPAATTSFSRSGQGNSPTSESDTWSSSQLGERKM